MNGQRMDRPGKLLGESLVDQAVPLYPALPGKQPRLNIDPEVGFALRAVPDMPGMEMRLVDDLKALRLERRQELFFDPRFDRHDAATLFRETVAP